MSATKQKLPTLEYASRATSPRSTGEVLWRVVLASGSILMALLAAMVVLGTVVASLRERPRVFPAYLLIVIPLFGGLALWQALNALALIVGLFQGMPEERPLIEVEPRMEEAKSRDGRSEVVNSCSPWLRAVRALL